MPVLQIRLSSEQLFNLQTAARARGVSPTTFARSLLFPNAQDRSGSTPPPQKDISPTKPSETPPAQSQSLFRQSEDCLSNKCFRFNKPICGPCRVLNGLSAVS